MAFAPRIAEFCALILLTVFAACLAVPSQAATKCPKSIAIVDDDFLSDKISKSVPNSYRKFGCDPEFVPVPGRRGIAMFNNGDVDGELMRIEKITPDYSRKFVRSTTPILTVKMALWGHPDVMARGELPTGYLHGIVWHERYVAKNPQLKVKKFYSRNSLFEAYNEGRLSGFIETDGILDKLKPAPVQKVLLNSFDLYHYLGIEFSEAMTKFSANYK